MTSNELLVTLLYPWSRAWVSAAWQDFSQTQEFSRTFAFGGLSLCAYKFATNDEYAKKSFMKHWARIVFLPWTFVSPVELFESELKERDKET